MKKSIILIISCLLLSTNLDAQVNYNDELDENRLVYWFQMRMREIEDDSTGYVALIITEVKSKLLHGTIIDYRDNLYYCLKNDIITVGPFNDFQEAWKSKQIYEHLVFGSKKEYYDDSFISKDSTYNDNQTVFWFIQQVEQGRKNKLELIRKPGAIASGAYFDFYSYTADNLMMRVLSIGPFLYMPEAEYSKHTYRIKKREYLRRKFIRKINIFSKK